MVPTSRPDRASASGGPGPRATPRNRNAKENSPKDLPLPTSVKPFANHKLGKYCPGTGGIFLSHGDFWPVSGSGGSLGRAGRGFLSHG